MTLSIDPPAVVVDASVAIELLTGSESWAARWRAWLESGAMLLAPAHFPAEVANGLLVGVRLPDPVVTSLLLEIERSGVEVADRGWMGVTESVALAERLDLTVYDAGYVHLAHDVAGALATVDRAMARAAEADGIEVLTA